MARVYVSSTYQDLQECRADVRLALQRLHQEDVAMETDVAEPDRPVDKCLKDVASCELYIGVFAWRYGYIPPSHDRSITELEYRTAVDNGIDRLIFLLDEEAPWPRSRIDREPDADRIEALRAELGREHLCSFFSTPQELTTLVTTALANWLRGRGHATNGAGLIAPEVLATYATRLQQQYGRLDLDALTPPQREEYLQILLRSVFVEQSVREDPPPLELPKELWQKLRAQGELKAEDLPAGIDLFDVRSAQEIYQRKPRRQALDVVTEPTAQRIVLLGDPGAGKSTLARYLALWLAAPDGDQRLAGFSGHLPLLIELRSYAGLQARGECRTPLEFLDHLAKTEGLGLNQETLDPYLTHDGRALVIFDGLDEIFDPQARDTIARQVAGFTAIYPAVRVIVTSRIVGYRRATLADAGFAHHTLQDLDEEQIGEFLTSWYALALHDRPEDGEQRRQRLLQAIKESPPIAEVAGNPLLLTILAIIGKHQELPRERWKVYDHAATVLVEHWDVNRHLRDRAVNADFLDEEDKKVLLRRVAHRMQAGTGGLAGNYIAGDALREEFQRYLSTRYQRDPVAAKTIADTMIAQFRERNFILSRYGADIYGFVHRAFLEYFCAEAFVWQFEKDQQLSPEQLMHDVFGAHWQDPSWQEVLRLIAGMVAERFAGDLIGYLASEAYEPWPSRFGDQPPRNIALAVQCLGELRNPSAVRAQAALLLRVLINLLEYSAGIEDEGLDRLLENEIVPAVTVIGEAWPQREEYLSWYQTRGSKLAWSPTSSYAARIGAALLPHSSDLRGLLSEVVHAADDWRFRNAGIEGLTQMASGDPETLALLRAWASNDPDAAVRQTAVQALARAARLDGETLALLRAWASNDPDAAVRQAAVRAIVAAAPGDGDTLALLRQLASNDRDAAVRQAAVRAIVAVAPGDGDTPALLRQLASNDEDADVRQVAVRAIVAAAPGQVDVLTLTAGFAASEAWVRRGGT
jgi:hypothetical protein